MEITTAAVDIDEAVIFAVPDMEVLNGVAGQEWGGRVTHNAGHIRPWAGGFTIWTLPNSCLMIISGVCMDEVKLALLYYEF